MALPRGQKIGYGAADTGASLSFVAINTWLFYFLVNVAGLTPGAAGAVFLLGRLFDALLDPVMGVVSDRLRGRWGRLAFVRWGAIPLGASFALVWLLPAGGPEARFGAALATFGLFSLLFTVVQVPYLALTPELATDYDERTALTSWRVGFGVTASLLAVAVPPLLVLPFSPGRTLAASAPAGWAAMGVVFGLVVAGAYLVTAGAVREPARARADAPPAGSLLAETRAAFVTFGFREVFALFVTITVGLMIVNSMLPFYLESALRVPAAQQPLVLGLLFGVSVAAFPLWTALSRRLGKRSALALGLALMAVGLLLLTAVGAGGVTPTLLALAALTGVGLSAATLLPWAMLPDVVEFGEARSGGRRDGLLYALFTFGQKAAGSAGVFANAIAASLFGYRPGLAEQDPGTVLGIRLMVGPVAAAVLVVALVLALRYPITREAHARVSARLSGRG